MKVRTSTEAANEAANKRSWSITQLGPEQVAELNRLADNSVALAALAPKGTLLPTLELIKHDLPDLPDIKVYQGPLHVFKALSLPNPTYTIPGLADEKPSASTKAGMLKDVMPALKAIFGGWTETSYEAIQGLSDPDRRGETRTAVKTTEAFLEVMNLLFNKLKPFLPAVVASHSQTIGFAFEVGDKICLAFLTVDNPVPPKAS